MDPVLPVFKPRHILSDIDGTVCNYCEEMRKAVFHNFGFILELNKVEYPARIDNLVDAMQAIEERYATEGSHEKIRDFLKTFITKETPYFQAGPYWDILKLYRKYWKRVYFITSRERYLKDVTLEWLGKYQFNVMRNQVFFKKKKEEFKSMRELCLVLGIPASEHVLVVDDDALYLEHVIRTRENTTVWLLVREWNADYPIVAPDSKNTIVRGAKSTELEGSHYSDRETARRILRGSVSDLDEYLSFYKAVH